MRGKIEEESEDRKNRGEGEKKADQRLVQP